MVSHSYHISTYSRLAKLTSQLKLAYDSCQALLKLVEENETLRRIVDNIPEVKPKRKPRKRKLKGSK